MKKTLIAALFGLMASPLALADNTVPAKPAETQPAAAVVVPKAEKPMAKKAMTKKPMKAAHSRSVAQHKLVAEIQMELNHKGYHVGKADGFAGKKTRAAIRKFQKDHHHRMTGKVSAQLLTELKAAK
ncbi:peptidoglycan-binding domain-containing protein [Celerinatantimonas yamalensis]|uniref:Peptidoglycan-binding domain-containing protein n=1 Tax=Celerinatantimonas yamalensis TaxID=559956 RepID=A0ABW9G4K5_9GAMM